jgi:hypothetical protein
VCYGFVDGDMREDDLALMARSDDVYGDEIMDSEPPGSSPSTGNAGSHIGEVDITDTKSQLSGGIFDHAGGGTTDNTLSDAASDGDQYCSPHEDPMTNGETYIDEIQDVRAYFIKVLAAWMAYVRLCWDEVVDEVSRSIREYVRWCSLRDGKRPFGLAFVLSFMTRAMALTGVLEKRAARSI